ncbi:YbgC/FadM family acyl-CoA thioesterase [Hyphomonas johnsonii]|jgi:acyl-CoA thioester hydrolase|uniref:Thioesterase family protein n=1 Tax=Hyphomonas johnsonii MHS-2 TaxID=1280950 RepID=A0A059FNS8_9PROT|nr:YbgC/FadM family acyl-CoA thioesterase [Hyphomonas johnsonii]KCZ92299.1 thioesterase family protein [Hyphomonas johnsonii MHS-2]
MTQPPLDDRHFDSDRQHWITVRVYYEDTDFTGMVYHANYLRFFERGRSDHLRDAGISHQSLLDREDPAAFTLTNVNVTYKRPAKVDDLLHIRTRYLGMDGPRIRFSQACLRDGQIVAEAEITAVMIHADGRLRRPIREVAEHLEAFVYKAK